jgi:hypothetical protein
VGALTIIPPFFDLLATIAAFLAAPLPDAT